MLTPFTPLCLRLWYGGGMCLRMSYVGGAGAFEEIDKQRTDNKVNARHKTGLGAYALYFVWVKHTGLLSLASTPFGLSITRCSTFPYIKAVQSITH